MRAVLIRMPFVEHEYTKFSEKWEYIEDEYIGVGIVEAILIQHQLDVCHIELSDNIRMVEEIQSINPDIIMISVMQSSARRSYEFVKLLRKNGYTGKIFIGGWFAKMAWREIFQYHWPVDYVCYIDAEDALSPWILDIYKDIYGIATYKNWHRQDSLRVHEKNGQGKYISPYRRPGRRTYSIETSRGCPHSRCTFCSQSCGNVIQNKWRPIPLRDVKEEILSIYNQFGVTRFATSDDDLLGPDYNTLVRTKELAKMIKSLPFHISFTASISVRSACCDEILDILQEVGLQQLCVGFESADPRQLRRYGKQQSLEENFLAAEKLSKRDLQLLPGLITFDPYSTQESIRKNLDFLFDNLHHYNISKLTKRLHLLTGSPFVSMCRKDGLLTGDYLGYEYKFKYEKVGMIYEAFNTYVDLVKGVEDTIKNNPQFNARELSESHRKIAKHILDINKIDEYIYEEIRHIKLSYGMDV